MAARGPADPDGQRAAGRLVLGGAVVICSVALFTISRFAEMSLSGMQFAHQAALWFQFAIAISLFAVYLPVHVAAGTTRRSFFRGAVIAATATAVGYAGVLATLLLLEGQIYGALGWFHGGDYDPSATVLATGVWPYVGGTILIFMAGTISGLLVAAAYYRWGAWRGTISLPLMLAPLILVSTLALDPQNQWTPFGSLFGVNGWWQPLLGVGLLALSGLAFHRLIARVPIR